MQVGENLAKANQLLNQLERTTPVGTGDAQLLATVAIAHAVLALAEQVAMVRRG